MDKKVIIENLIGLCSKDLRFYKESGTSIERKVILETIDDAIKRAEENVSNFDGSTLTEEDIGDIEFELESRFSVSIGSQTIIISPVFTIYIPNAFTPNNDLHNDYFLPITDGVSEFELTIYDRSGKEVFKTNDFSNDYLSCITDNACNAAWNGKIKNGDEYATKGLYVYKINLTDFNGKLRAYSGSFTLIR